MADPPTDASGEPITPRTPRVQAILLGPAGASPFSVFNPNEWHARSKAIVSTCAAELSCLQYAAMSIERICRNPIERCSPHLDTFRRNGGTPDAIETCDFLGQDLELHLAIEGYFSSVKTLLDMLVQLLVSEHVVAGVHVHGFNKDGDDPGGKILAILRRNVVADKKAVADRLDALIRDHKRRWIDAAIRTRDDLVHPEHGTRDLMFALRFASNGGVIVIEQARPPYCDGVPVAVYAMDRLADAAAFAAAFLAALRTSYARTPGQQGPSP